MTTRTQAWKRLAQCAGSLASTPTRDLFGRDSARFHAFSTGACGLLLDYSRQHLDADAMGGLRDLADSVQLDAAIAAMFRGDPVNASEGRAALHAALRQPDGDAVGGPAIAALVAAERRRMFAFAEAVRTGQVVGARGDRFEIVINIGIGGSDLGPAMAVEALRAWTKGSPQVAFVSNVDGCGLADLLADADPAATLFIVASKTFTTQETMANAQTARAWLRSALGEAAVHSHFAAVSVNSAAMDSFGVHPDYRFDMWDWVGGRYSIWSSIGLSLAIAIGPENFSEFLAGGHEMDVHFRSAGWSENLPVLMGLLGIWNINFQGLPTLAVLPYTSRLARFPAFLQQLEMESNGKRVSSEGVTLAEQTAPVVWGEPGNNAQHSFFQLLHQGTPRAALDMLLPSLSGCGNPQQHQLAIANCLAQADVFMRGQQAPGLPACKFQEGSRPVSLLLFEQLDPKTLGRIVALYEHKVYVQSVIWGINAFDQWGVELGKKAADGMLKVLRGQPDAPAVDASLAGTIRAVQKFSGAP